MYKSAIYLLDVYKSTAWKWVIRKEEKKKAYTQLSELTKAFAELMCVSGV
jgi:hypothetical protein